jgi:hypothetical protein
VFSPCLLPAFDGGLLCTFWTSSFALGSSAVSGSGAASSVASESWGNRSLSWSSLLSYFFTFNGTARMPSMQHTGAGVRLKSIEGIQDNVLIVGVCVLWELVTCSKVKTI